MQLAVVFLATPAEVSMELAPVMLAAGAQVVDLSGAFRLRTPENYAAWYKETAHPARTAGRGRLRPARVLPRADPGRAAGLESRAATRLPPISPSGRWSKPASIDRRAGIVCDAKSGVSGAGRKPSLKTSFCEVTENFSAYSILAPSPRAGSAAQSPASRSSEFSFTAQLLPLDRGHPGNHLLPRRGALPVPKTCSPSTKSGMPASLSSASINPAHMPDLRGVARTNFCDIGVTFDAAHRAAPSWSAPSITW